MVTMEKTLTEKKKKKPLSFTSCGAQIGHRASVLRPLFDLSGPVVLLVLLLQVLHVSHPGTGRAPAAAATPPSTPTGRLVVVDHREDHDVQEQQRATDAYGHGQCQREGRVTSAARAAVVLTVSRRRRPATAAAAATAVHADAVLVVRVLELSSTAVAAVTVATVGRRRRRHHDRRRLQHVRTVQPGSVRGLVAGRRLLHDGRLLSAAVVYVRRRSGRPLRALRTTKPPGSEVMKWRTAGDGIARDPR